MCRTIKESPIINAVIDKEGKNMIYRDYVDMIVPLHNSVTQCSVNVVIRDCESKNYTEILKELIKRQDQVEKNTISVEETMGGTISINPNFNGLLSVGSIEENTTVKLGINKITKKPHCVDNNAKRIEPRDMMMVSLTYDHRIIDGKEGVLFLKNVKNLIENPLKLVFDM